MYPLENSASVLSVIFSPFQKVYQKSPFGVENGLAKLQAHKLMLYMIWQSKKYVKSVLYGLKWCLGLLKTVEAAQLLLSFS